MRHAPIVQVLQRAGQAGSDARGRRARKRATRLLAQKLAQERDQIRETLVQYHFPLFRSAVGDVLLYFGGRFY